MELLYLHLKAAALQLVSCVCVWVVGKNNYYDLVVDAGVMKQWTRLSVDGLCDGTDGG